MISAQTRQFAERAIEAEPAAYARAVTDDVLHTFGWTRQVRDPQRLRTGTARTSGSSAPRR